MSLIKKGDPEKVDKITLGIDTYIDTLYGCFRFDNPKIERFSTRKNVEMIFKSGKKIEVIVPENMKISLNDKLKVAHSPNFVLEQITGYEDTMKLLTMRAGWNQNDRDIERLVSYDPEGAFVGKIKTKDYDIPVS